MVISSKWALAIFVVVMTAAAACYTIVFGQKPFIDFLTNVYMTLWWNCCKHNRFNWLHNRLENGDTNGTDDIVRKLFLEISF